MIWNCRLPYGRRRVVSSCCISFCGRRQATKRGDAKINSTIENAIVNHVGEADIKSRLSLSSLLKTRFDDIYRGTTTQWPLKAIVELTTPTLRCACMRASPGSAAPNPSSQRNPEMMESMRENGRRRSSSHHSHRAGIRDRVFQRFPPSHACCACMVRHAGIQATGTDGRRAAVNPLLFLLTLLKLSFAQLSCGETLLRR